jgi:FkbM family methyltransferase
VRGSLIYLNVNESPMMRRRAQGVFEPAKHAAFKYFLESGDVVIDAGANKGDFSLWASRLVGPSGKVFSYEPEPENCKWIRKSISVNDYMNIKLRQVALSDENGKVDLFLGAKSGWHSIIDKDGRPYMTGEKIQVPSVTLDSEMNGQGINKIKLVKMDVQGAEIKILRGAKEILSKSDDVVLLIDLHPKEIDVLEVGEILESYGFEIFKTKPPYTQKAKNFMRMHEITARKK